ncbi:HD domain-containing phosphohydrolase [Paenibacillus rhizoplanae]
MVLLIGTLFSSIAAWLLTNSVQHPIHELYQAMNQVKDGNLVQVQDEYSDEFSKLVAGFNMMVRGLQAREQQSRQLLDSYFSTLAVALDARDSYTAGHSLRVAEYSVIIGQLAGLRGQELDDLRKSALLHDIGKIGVRDSILFKEEALTDEEFLQIQSHTVLGENILRQIEPADKMAPFLGGVRSHHERYDGHGYPDGLAGMNIPLHGRIIAVADAYDAMTSDRPYRKRDGPRTGAGHSGAGQRQPVGPRIRRIVPGLFRTEAGSPQGCAAGPSRVIHSLSALSFYSLPKRILSSLWRFRFGFACLFCELTWKCDN